MNLIRNKISLYVAAIMLCFLSVIAYADSNVYAQEETGKRIGLNYSEVTMFPSQKVSLEVQGEVIKGDRVSKEEYYNRINEIEKHNGQEPWFASHALYNDFYYLEVSYSSDNEKVQVSDEGVIYADKDIVDVTTATITVNYKFYGWSYENEKTNIEASEKCSVIVDKGTILGDDIVASGLTSSYLLSSQYTIGEVKWSVDNEKVATLSSDGILTANVYGSVTITVTVTDGELENAITKVVRISDPKFKKSTEAIAVGGSYEVELTGVYDDSVKTYKSSKVKCVKVSEVGLVYVVKKTSKDVTITAIIDGRKITMTVKVTNPVFNRGDANPILLVKGKKLKLTVKGLVDGISKVKYSSDKTDIATVTKKGKVKAKKYGSCYIIAEVDHKIVKINCAVGKKKAIKAVKNAYAVYGCPYSQPKRMNAGYYDCSSLAWRSYKKCGIYVGNVKGKWAATAAEECRYLFAKHKRISKKACKTKKLRPGDLVFYSGWKNGRYRNITHVAIYVGNDTLIEANWPNGVREASYSKNKKYIVGIGRPVK